jgi:hypothetical protein
MKEFNLAFFDGLPEPVRARILQCLRECLLWRGRIAVYAGEPAVATRLEEIAQLLAWHGLEMEEYT